MTNQPYAVIRGDGVVIAVGTCADADLPLQAGTGQTVAALTAEQHETLRARLAGWRMTDGELVRAT